MSKKVFVVFSVLLAIVMIVSVTQPAFSSNDGKMRVWVEFSPGNAARVEKSLQGMGAEFHYRFEDLNSFVVTVPEQALAGLSRNPNVVSVEEDAIRYPAADNVPYGIDMVQARDVWDENRDGVVDAGASTGSNRIVCIIDSGVYKQHEDFSGVNFLGGYPTGWDTDKCGHGTHVAGTITAANNEIGVVGVNPGTTNLYIVKVFGDDCGWTYSSTLADAANRCEAAGADVISMSLGGAKSNRIEERAFDTLYSKGVLSIAAAGNEGTTAYNYPASYSSVVSVAAIDANKVVADFSQFNNQVELAAPGVSVMSTVPFKNTATVTVNGVTYSGNQIEYAQLFKYGVSGALVDGGLCDTTGAWGGKVVLCQRGVISFYDKVNNVQQGEGAAAIIYNNEPGDFLGTLGEGYSSSIPAISLSQENGQLLIANELGESATVVTDSEIPASGYEAWDGTSMATPHVSGVAALVWSANPAWTNVKIRETLNETAIDLGDLGRDNFYGFGLVQAKAALDYLGGGDPPPPPPPPPADIKITVSTDSLSYSTNSTVKITTVVTDGENKPVTGASVNVKITLGGSSVASLNGITDASGTASFSYKIKKNATPGQYSVTATASKDSITSLPATTNFTVTK